MRLRGQEGGRRGVHCRTVFVQHSPARRMRVGLLIDEEAAEKEDVNRATRARCPKNRRPNA